MKKQRLLLCVTAGLGISSLSAAPVQWTTGLGHNNHFYEPVWDRTSLVTWSDAQAAATLKGGYLVTLTSAEENSFVASLITDTAKYWVLEQGGGFTYALGPFIGASQPAGSTEPSGGWQWENSEGLLASGFTHWAPNEPSNSNGGEKYGQFFTIGSHNPSDNWNDVVPDIRLPAYVIEYTPQASPVPEVTTYAGFAFAALLAGGAIKSRCKALSR